MKSERNRAPTLLTETAFQDMLFDTVAHSSANTVVDVYTKTWKTESARIPNIVKSNPVKE